VFLGAGDGSFLMVTNNNIFDAMGGALAVGDFSGDAKADLAVVTDPANLHLLLDDGTGAFQNVTNYDRYRCMAHDQSLERQTRVRQNTP